jgi:hypothetical protein
MRSLGHRWFRSLGPLGGQLRGASGWSSSITRDGLLLGLSIASQAVSRGSPDILPFVALGKPGGNLNIHSPFGGEHGVTGATIQTLFIKRGHQRRLVVAASGLGNN